ELERRKEVLQTLETKLDLEKRKAYGKEDEIGDYTSWLEKSRGDPKLKDTKKIPDWGSTIELERKKEVLQTLETKLDLEKRKAYGKEDEIGDYTSWLEKSRGDPKLKDTKKIPDWGSTIVSINATSENHFGGKKPC
ncbi:hypothetical protein DIPPA_06832, partial [Diplonema papillatum]